MTLTCFLSCLSVTPCAISTCVLSCRGRAGNRPEREVTFEWVWMTSEREQGPGSQLTHIQWKRTFSRQGEAGWRWRWRWGGGGAFGRGTWSNRACPFFSQALLFYLRTTSALQGPWTVAWWKNEWIILFYCSLSLSLSLSGVLSLSFWCSMSFFFSLAVAPSVLSLSFFPLFLSLSLSHFATSLSPVLLCQTYILQSTSCHCLFPLQKKETSQGLCANQTDCPDAHHGSAWKLKPGPDGKARPRKGFSAVQWHMLSACKHVRRFQENWKTLGALMLSWWKTDSFLVVIKATWLVE